MTWEDYDPRNWDWSNLDPRTWVPEEERSFLERQLYDLSELVADQDPNLVMGLAFVVTIMGASAPFLVRGITRSHNEREDREAANNALETYGVIDRPGLRLESYLELYDAAAYLDGKEMLHTQSCLTQLYPTVAHIIQSDSQNELQLQDPNDLFSRLTIESSARWATALKKHIDHGTKYHGGNATHEYAKLIS